MIAAQGGIPLDPDEAVVKQGQPPVCESGVNEHRGTPAQGRNRQGRPSARPAFAVAGVPVPQVPAPPAQRLLNFGHESSIVFVSDGEFA